MGSGASKKPSDQLSQEVDALFGEETVPGSDNNSFLASALGIPETHKESIDVTDYIYLIHYDDFAKVGSFPRNPQHAHYLQKLSKIPRETSFIVYISHVWIRNDPSSPGWEGSPHPDYRFAYKYKLCLDGIKRAHSMYAPGMRECFIWLDYTCLNQDRLMADIEPNVLLFDKIMCYADCIFTPIFIEGEGYEKHVRLSHVNDPHHRTFTANRKDNETITTLHNAPSTINLENHTVPDYYSLYEGAPLFNEKANPRAYLSRAWCRTELLYAAVMPLLEDHESDVVKRKSKFSSTFRTHTANGHRTHLLYTSFECRNQLAPIVLPMLPLQELLVRYSPIKGHTTQADDADIIARLFAMLRPKCKDAITRKSVANLLERGGDTTQRPTLLSSGNVFMGQSSRRLNVEENGVSDKAVAETVRHGQGLNKSSHLVVYKGNYVDDKREGYGTEKTPTGLEYFGEYSQDKKHGHGMLKYPNGDVYEGSFADDKKHGKGTYKYGNGDVYTGDFAFDVKCGQGHCKYANGDSYTGAYDNDLFHGQGQFNFENGQMYKGQWVKGLYTM